MTFDEYRNHDAVALAALIKAKHVSPSELLDIAIKHTEQVNPAINAVITPLYDFARDQLKQLNAAAPFSGVPFLLKDLDVQFKVDPILWTGKRRN